MATDINDRPLTADELQAGQRHDAYAVLCCWCTRCCADRGVTLVPRREPIHEAPKTKGGKKR